MIMKYGTLIFFVLLASSNYLFVVGQSHQDALNKLHKLQALDEEICYHGRRLFNVIITLGPLAKRHREGVEKSVHVAGSVAEGSTIPRLFGKNDEFESGINREVEMDIEYVLMQMTDNMANQVKDIEGKTGYVQVKSSTQLLANSRMRGWKVSDKTIDEYYSRIRSPDGWFQPYKIKTVAKEKVEFRDPKELVQVILAAALKTKKKKVKVLPTSNKVTKSSVASEFMLNVHGKNFLKVSFDTVPLIKLSWNPGFATQWRNRKRKWPSLAAIDGLLSDGGFLIAKPSVGEKYNEDSTEMRYAFAHIERKLVEMRGKHQNFVYMIFKVMLTKWVKSIDEDQLSSFIAKTVMFWTCEEYPPQHEIWNPGYDSLLRVLKHLFKKLLEAFQKGDLPYYFNEKVNVIEAVSPRTTKRVIERIGEILENTERFLPLDYDREYKAGEEILDCIKSTTEVLEELKRKDFSRLLRQPELIVDVLKILIDDLDLKDITKKIGNELGRFGEKVEDELKRFGKRAEDEIKRSGKKVEKELKRFAKRIGL